MRHLTNYVLGPDGEGAPEPDLMTWARWFEDHGEDRTLAKTDVGDATVSTVFLGVDHAFIGGPPILWETMIFGGLRDQDQWRYRSRGEAQRGHDAIVDALGHGEVPPQELCDGLLVLAVDGERREGPCRLAAGHKGDHKATIR